MSDRAERYGDGRLFLRNGIWWMDFSVDGRRIRQSTGTDKKTDARRILRERHAQALHGQLPEQPRKVTLRELQARVHALYELKERNSIPHVARAFRPLREFFGTRPVAKLTTGDLERYVAWRLAGNGIAPTARVQSVKPATVHIELALLRVGLRHLHKAGELARVPMFPSLSIRNTREGFFTDEDLAKVTPHLRDPLPDVVTFCYLTGWRCAAEVLPLTWADVDPVAGVIRLPASRSKNKDGRELPYLAMPELRAIVARAAAARELVHEMTGTRPERVFHRRGKPIKDFRGAWAKAVAAGGVRANLIHDLRRSAVRNLERAGAPRSQAMKLTGHKTEAVYRRYAITSTDDVASAMARVAELRALEAEAREKSQRLAQERHTEGGTAP